MSDPSCGRRASAPAPDRRPSPAVRLLLAPVRWYQRFISPALPPRCRYYPSCSQYAVEALATHGVLKGLLLSGWRLLRCNPLSPGGVDHVPDPGSWRYPYPHDIPRPQAQDPTPSAT